MTPKEAFDAVKKLWPTTAYIKPFGNDSWEARCDRDFMVASSNTSKIDWGKIICFPLPEPKYELAKASDVTFPWKEVWIKDPGFYEVDKSFRSRYLCGVYVDAEGKMIFITTDGKHHKEVFIKLP